MRALTPWRPRELSTLQREIDHLFNRFFGPEDQWFTRDFETTMVPAIESYVKDGDLVVKADLPGIDPKQLEISVERDRLHIKGERKEESEKKDREYLYREMSFGRFERVIPLPAGVDPDTVKASYHDGVLEIMMQLPKERQGKKVPITVQ